MRPRGGFCGCVGSSGAFPLCWLPMGVYKKHSRPSTGVRAACPSSWEMRSDARMPQIYFGPRNYLHWVIYNHVHIFYFLHTHETQPSHNTVMYACGSTTHNITGKNIQGAPTRANNTGKLYTAELPKAHHDQSGSVTSELCLPLIFCGRTRANFRFLGLPADSKLGNLPGK